jgi:hypothetical protein
MVTHSSFTVEDGPLSAVFADERRDRTTPFSILNLPIYAEFIRCQLC